MDISDTARKRHADVQRPGPLHVAAFRGEIGSEHGLPHRDLPATVALCETLIVDFALSGNWIEMLTPGIKIYDKFTAIDRLLVAAKAATMAFRFPGWVFTRSFADSTHLFLTSRHGTQRHAGGGIHGRQDL